MSSLTDCKLTGWSCHHHHHSVLRHFVHAVHGFDGLPSILMSGSSNTLVFVLGKKIVLVGLFEKFKKFDRKFW